MMSATKNAMKSASLLRLCPRLGAAMIVLAAGTCLAQNSGEAVAQPAQQEGTVRVGVPQHAAPKAEVAPSNQQPEAKALLEKSRDVIIAAKTLEFDVSAPQVNLMGGDRSPKNVKAHMILIRNDAGGWVMRLTGSGTIGKDAAPTEFDVVWDQRSITWVDHQAKTVYTRPFGNAKGLRNTLQMINGLRLTTITGDRPFGEELAQSTIVMAGTDEAGGVPCDVVIAGTSAEGNGNRKRLSIAKSDHFPRKIENIIDSRLINASTAVELSNVKINESIPSERVFIATPDGYAVDKSEPAAPKAVKLDKLAVPDFELVMLDGTKVSKGSLAGNVAVIQFWGTWSNPSKRSHAELQQLADSYKDKGVKFFIASVREKDPESVKAYIAESGVTLPVLLEGDSLIERLDVQSVPTAVVIGADGANVKVVSNYLKETTMKELGEGIEHALKDAAEKKAAAEAAPAQAAPQGDAKPAGQ